jgi:hypothetical protein
MSSKDQFSIKWSLLTETRCGSWKVIGGKIDYRIFHSGTALGESSPE